MTRVEGLDTALPARSPRGGTNSGRLGIIAGGGALPAHVAAAAAGGGHDPFIVALKGFAGPAVERFPHIFVHAGQFARIFSELRRQGCTDIILIGSFSRPKLLKQRFDIGFVRALPRLINLLKKGDDGALRGVARMFEEQGFRVRGAHEIAPELLVPLGTLGGVSPSASHRAEIALGLEVLAALSPFDVGQAAVVAGRRVLAIEGAEGTDAMLSRCATLRKEPGHMRRGVLVKAPKIGQDMRLDIPAAGPRTVELVAAAGLAGIALAADAVLLAEQESTIAKADSLGIFVEGVRTRSAGV
jgi:DUF1009 family protein